jgi:hypothetical protein
MRALICLCLATGLWAGDPPRPGLDRAFLADAGDGSKPWKTFRVPMESASAVVEVLGEFTKEELRQVTFQEFVAWFQEDLRKFWRSQGVTVPDRGLASATLPVNRYGGNALPQDTPLVRVNF